MCSCPGCTGCCTHNRADLTDQCTGRGVGDVVLGRAHHRTDLADQRTRSDVVVRGRANDCGTGADKRTRSLVVGDVRGCSSNGADLSNQRTGCVMRYCRCYAARCSDNCCARANQCTGGIVRYWPYRG